LGETEAEALDARFAAFSPSRAFCIAVFGTLMIVCIAAVNRANVALLGGFFIRFHDNAG
jgi:hypothetical protein